MKFLEAKDKANILNKHFQSVFTNEDTANTPNKSLSPFPEIEDIVFTTAGIEKQLRNLKIEDIVFTTAGIEKQLGNLKPSKAAGPDRYRHGY